MGGKQSRTKGHSFERYIANKLKCIFPKARRHLEYQDGEAYGVDLANTGNLKIQCKKRKNYVSINTIQEIKSDGIPVLITAGDRQEAMVVIPLDHFIKILCDIGEVYE